MAVLFTELLVCHLSHVSWIIFFHQPNLEMKAYLSPFPYEL